MSILMHFNNKVSIQKIIKQRLKNIICAFICQMQTGADCLQTTAVASMAGRLLPGAGVKVTEAKALKVDAVMVV